MLEDNIKIGDRIEISSASKGVNKSYASQVEHIVDKDLMVIHVPISYGNLVKLPLKTAYSFLFFTGKGMISMQAKITRYFVEEGFHMMEIRLSGAAQRVQRREFFRFSCFFPMKYGAVVPGYDLATNTPSPAMFEGIVRDISAGGIRFASAHEMDDNTIIKCVMLLGDESFTAMAKVLQSYELKKPSYKFQYRAMFLDLTAAQKESIVKFIFTEQRKSLKKGLS